MVNKDVPTVYTDADMKKILKNITNPAEREVKEAWLQEFGEFGAIMNNLHALEPNPSMRTDALINRIVKSVSAFTERITG